MKLWLNPITARKITNFQNTVRCLKIILPSLFFLLIIRASIWSPYGKNLVDPPYDQKDDVIAKYCHKLRNLRIHLVFFMPFIKPIFWNSHFKILVESHYKGNDDQFAKKLSNASESSFSGSILLLIIRATFWSCYCEIRNKPHCGPKYGQFPKHCHRPFILRFPLV